MSQSQQAAVPARSTDQPSTEFEPVDDVPAARALLSALNDERCRSIIAATTEEPQSATELSDACDIPLSTTYRKLETLTDAGLLAERTRISPGGSHPSEYSLRLEDVVLSVGGEGIELRVAADASREARPHSPPVASR